MGDVQARIIGLAERYPDVVMPGYTHLQRGQCLLFSHYIMSFFWQLERGRGRLADALKRLDALPLGSGALAGTSVDLDRDYLKDLLGFGALTENSYDAVSDRGFILETLFALALVLLDLSRMAEDFVLFSSAEFGFLRLDDSIATSSSLMPQKKNPDLFELIRSGPARLFGWLGQLFMVVKGLPSSYNKDLQEDKSALREGTEYAAAVLEVTGLALERIALDRERIREKLSPGLFATDLVAYLTDRGVRFREAHGLVSEIVAYAEMRDQSLSLLTLEELQAFHPAFDTDVYEVFDPLRSVAKKRTEGSTNPEMVRRQIESAKRRLESR
jgi:argininosuccinate lyase